MALVDLLAIAPSLLHVFVPYALDLRFLRVLRLLRLFRLLRFGRLGYAFSTLVRVIHTRRVELGVLSRQQAEAKQGAVCPHCGGALDEHA